MTATKSPTRTKKANKAKSVAPKIRNLRPGDLSAVVAIDRTWVGRSRRGFFEKRIAAVQQAPDSYVTLGVESGGQLTGYVIARFGRGEFGTDTLTAAVDAVGVDKTKAGKGFGRRLMKALDKELNKVNVRYVFSQTDWDNRSLLEYFAQAGFSLAPRALLERRVDGGRAIQNEEIPDNIFEFSGNDRELDFSDPSGDDFQSLARDRVPVRAMTEEDLHDIVDIDRRILGVDRKAYYRRLMIQALAESGVRVSLSAVLDNRVVGYIMARVDYGEFGRAEPVAVMDTIGVHPDYQHGQIGMALLSQLDVNLSALQMESMRTVVRWNDFDLLRFLGRNGFEPSQRLALWRQLN